MTSAPTVRRVVVGFDGSEPSGDALVLAQRLADPGGSELLLACVDAQRGFRLPHPRRQETAAAVLVAGREQIGGGFRVTGIERAASSAARGLTEIAEEERADLLVLGAHHDGPKNCATPGPTAHRLLQGAPCAVAIAPLGLRDLERFHHVGVAYDGSREADAALAAAYALAARTGAAVSLFLTVPLGGVAHAGAMAPERDAAAQAQRNHAQEQLDAAADAAPKGLNPRIVLLRGDPAREIARASNGIVDVLFVGSRGYGPVHRVLAGSVSEALLLAATQPVVVLPRGSLAAATAGQGAPATTAP